MAIWCWLIDGDSLLQQHTLVWKWSKRRKWKRVCLYNAPKLHYHSHSPSSFFAFKVGGELSAHELFIRREGTLLFKFDQTNKGKHPDDSLDSDGGAPWGADRFWKSCLGRVYACNLSLRFDFHLSWMQREGRMKISNQYASSGQDTTPYGSKPLLWKIIVYSTFKLLLGGKWEKKLTFYHFRPTQTYIR